MSEMDGLESTDFKIMIAVDNMMNQLLVIEVSGRVYLCVKVSVRINP